MEMQITLANKWPVDDKYRYMTGNPTNRYKTVKSLERELTAQSWPQPGMEKIKYNFCKINKCVLSQIVSIIILPNVFLNSTFILQVHAY